MRPLNNRYVQALLSYLERPSLQVLVVLTVATLAVEAFVDELGHFYFSTLLWFLLDMFGHLLPPTLALVLLVGFVLQARTQLSDWRAAVTPGFRAPHVFAAMVMMSAWAAATALCQSKWAGSWNESFVGDLLVMFTIVTVLAWAILGPSRWWMIVIAAVLLIAPRRYLWFSGQFLSRGSSPEQLLVRCLLLGGEFMFLLMLLRAVPAAGLREPHPLAARLRSVFRPWQTSRYTTVAHVPVSGLWHRALHRRLAVLPRRASAWIGGLVFAFLVITAFIASRQHDSTGVLRALLIATLLPGIIAAAIWRERWPVFGVEWLFPTRPREFVRETAVVMAMNLLEFWLAGMASAVLGIALWQRQAFFTAGFALSLLASVLVQVLVFGGLFLMTPFRATVPYLLIMTLLMIGIAIPFELAWAPQPAITVSRLVVIADLAMVTGLCLAWLGIWPWARLEPG